MILAILFALFVWWFSTGAIFWMVSRGAGRAEVIFSFPLAAGAAWGLVQVAGQPGVYSAYVGFSTAIVIWGWFELAFLTGMITGPNRRSCPPGLSGPRRFVLAWGTLAHHELALLATAILLGAATWNLPDHTGLWTFLVLFLARISAKLNVYLGVSNLSHEMMPDQLAHMKTYFSERRMNWLFPVSVSVLTMAIVCWIDRAIAAESGATGFILLTVLTVMALIEHWLLVLPVRDAALWNWMTKREAAPRDAEPAE